MLGYATSDEWQERVRRAVQQSLAMWWQFFDGIERLIPQPELRTVIERDYRAMEGMILGEAPDFGWVLEQLERAEAAINGR